MPRNFSSLSPSEVLQAAISIEQRNADVYHRFAEMFAEFGDEESLEIASVFWEMAVEERGHRALLEEKYVRSYGPLSATFSERELCELVEVPKLETTDIFGSTSEASARERALLVALQAEISAQHFYAELAEQTPKGPLRQIFQELAQMEDGHVTVLESKLTSDSVAKQSVQ
jgi:erythrin-vacuolar iron transport family protein